MWVRREWEVNEGVGIGSLVRPDFNDAASLTWLATKATETRMLLAGLKVVEMSTWIAAPGCAMIMAEWAPTW